MKFLVDAQRPPALAEWLCKTGYEAHHVRDVALRDADDAEIRAYASRTGAMVVTKDCDFVPTNETQEKVIQVVWVRIGNATTRAVLERIQTAWPQLLAHPNEGTQLVELR